MSQPARVLEGADVRRLIRHVGSHRHATRNHVMVLLSFKAGLRACEIAGLEWPMVLKPGGGVAPLMFVSGRITKNGNARCVPIHPDLKSALASLKREGSHPRDGPVILSERGAAMTARSVVNWFRATYAELDMPGCSSHSGRRSFITMAARNVHRSGCSLRDVQLLAGHRSIETTERYIDGDTCAQRRLVAYI